MRIKIFALSIISITMLSSYNSADELLIVPGSGIGKIVIGKSSLGDAVKVFGETKIQKEKINSKKGCIALHMKWWQLSYAEQGIEFTSYNRKKIIDDIVLSNGCKYKTSEGIGIGTKMQDVLEKMGAPKNAEYGDLRYDGITFHMLIRSSITCATARTQSYSEFPTDSVVMDIFITKQ